MTFSCSIINHHLMPANLKVAKWLFLPLIITQFLDKLYTARKVKSILILLFIRQGFTFLKKNWPTLKNIILTNSICVYLLLLTKKLIWTQSFKSNEKFVFIIILLFLMVLMYQPQPTVPGLFIKQSTIGMN